MSEQGQVNYVYHDDCLYVPSDELAKNMGAEHEIIVHQIEQHILPQLDEDFGMENFRRVQRCLEGDEDNCYPVYLITLQGFNIMCFPAALAPVVMVYLHGFNQFGEQMSARKQAEDRRILQNITKDIEGLNKYYSC